jgi:LuxR family maltose regulon positive regulatory protein
VSARRRSPQLALAPAPAALPARRTEVRRDRLVRALAGDDARLRLIVAPAGYGKTTALEQWEAHDPRPFAWVTAGRDGDGARRLLADVAWALDAMEPLDRSIVGCLTTSEDDVVAVVLPRLRRALAGRRTAIVLVVDEAEALRAPDGVAVLRGLHASLPPGSALAVSSRREPALSLGRLRAAGDVVEVGVRDLAMTRGEAWEALAAAGLTLHGEQVDALVARTEGWPAGLALAAVAVRDADDLADAVAGFAGDDRIVADYLREEVLARLPEEQVAFLQATSPLDELSGPLCDAVLGSHGSGATLRDLARTTLMLAPLDRGDERFHCHALLAEAMRGDLRRTDPEREADVHRRAAAWYAEHGDLDRAIAHAVAGGDPERAGALLWSAVPGHATRGRARTLERWLTGFAPEQLAAHAELALTAASVHLVHGDRDMVERWALVAEALLRDAGPPRRDDLEGAVALMRAVVARDGVERMRADAFHAYALEPEASAWRALACLLAGMADVLAGDTAEGRARLEEGTRRGAMGAPAVQVLCLAALSLLELVDERWDEGGRLADLARAQVERAGLADYPACALPYAVSALFRAHRGRVGDARQDAREARRLLRELRDFTPVLAGATAIALARAELRLGDVRGAKAMLAEAERALLGAPDAPVLRGWVADGWVRAGAFADGAAAPESLTAAELRVLQFLPTHLPFREIAAQLRVSANTVKTQAHALYRKLDASSRSEAVAHARRLGLLDV